MAFMAPKKYLYFQDFCTGVSIIQQGGHLTSPGLERLKELSGLKVIRRIAEYDK